MAGDNNRLDLNSDLESITGDLLKDVKAATEQVKQRKAADRAKDLKDAQQGKTRKNSAIIIGIAAFVLILLAYWVVFGRGSDQAGSNAVGPSAGQGVNSTVTNPVVTPAAPKAPQRVTPPAHTAPQPDRPQNEPDDSGSGGM